MNPTFTPKPPTKPGWYLWRANEVDHPTPVEVHHDGYLFTGNPAWREKADWGLWCRLVPAEEVENAYWEGEEHGVTSEGTWQDSRARKVMEGEV